MPTASVSQLNRLGPLDSDLWARPACRARPDDELWTADVARRIVSIVTANTYTRSDLGCCRPLALGGKLIPLLAFSVETNQTEAEAAGLCLVTQDAENDLHEVVVM